MCSRIGESSWQASGLWVWEGGSGGSSPGTPPSLRVRGGGEARAPHPTPLLELLLLGKDFLSESSSSSSSSPIAVDAVNDNTSRECVLLRALLGPFLFPSPSPSSSCMSAMMKESPCAICVARYSSRCDLSSSTERTRSPRSTLRWRNAAVLAAAEGTADEVAEEEGGGAGQKGSSSSASASSLEGRSGVSNEIAKECDPDAGFDFVEELSTPPPAGPGEYDRRPPSMLAAVLIASADVYPDSELLLPLSTPPAPLLL